MRIERGRVLNSESNNFSEKSVESALRCPKPSILASGTGLTAIIKPTHECNFACSYCYVHPDAEAGTMNHQTLRTTIQKVVAYNCNRAKSSHFIWHGGEPLLMGVNFFQEALQIQKECKSKQQITNSIQTNGSLICAALLDLCKSNKEFRIGFSFDGPAKFQNLFRPMRERKSSFKVVMRNLKIAKHYLGRSPGVLIVIHKCNLDYLDSIYHFFQSKQLDFKVNPIILSGRAESSTDLMISPEEFGEAMIRLFDLWFYDQQSSILIDPFDKIIGNLFLGQPIGCNFSKTCRGAFISIGPKGDVYPCGRFDGLESFRMGNINEDSIEDLLSTELHKILEKRTAATIDECYKCHYQTICSGGCMHNALACRGNIFSRDWYCEGYRLLFKHIDKVLVKELWPATSKKRLDNRDNHTSILSHHSMEINLEQVVNVHLKKILRNRLNCVSSSTKAHTETYHTDWADKVYGDGYTDYYSEHSETTYSDHYDEPRD